jgi:hypothetical protein
MTTDLELALAHFRTAADLLESLRDNDDLMARASTLADARLAYGAGVRRLSRPPAPEYADIHAELERFERRVRAMLDSEEDDRTARYLMAADGSMLARMNDVNRLHG